MKKVINIIIVEKDDMMFDRLRQDIKECSPYVNKIYRSSYHNDIYKINQWHKCKLIIAHNPENAGLVFFNSLYRDIKVQKYNIFGLIYTRGVQNEIKFYKIIRSLHEWSNHLFLGVIYKRYGSLEKILETIRNIANGWQCYPIIDWMQKEEQPAIFKPERLISLRKLHNLKYEILSRLQPLIITLKEFNDNAKKTTLKKTIKNNDLYFADINLAFRNLQTCIKDFLQLDFKGKKLDNEGGETEISIYTKQLKKFVNIANLTSPNDLNSYFSIFSNIDYDLILSQLIIKKRDGSLERFFIEYDEFTRSLSKLINLLDKQYFLR